MLTRYSVPVATLKRTLGPLGAAGIGLSAMLGAGVFWVWGPVVERAGPFFFLAVFLAGVVALLNALSMAQLAFLSPVAGGAYAYAKEHVSPGAGFLAGWFFVIGKTASAAAVALIAATYLSPQNASWLAPTFIAILSVINMSGIRSTALVATVIACIVIAVLAGVIIGVPWPAETVGTPDGTRFFGVWQAAGLMFFAFAGYARMATLGAEVKNPTIVLPRVIVATLVAVIVLYSFLGAALLAALGFEGIVRSATPVIDSVPGAWSPVIAGVAVLASLGSLMTILTGLSRTSYAMAGAGDMPAVLARIWSRTSSPVVADISTALVAMVLSLTLTPLWLVALSSASVLSYYALAHLAALRLHSSQRRIPQWVSWCGLVGCVLLVVALPLPSVATGVIVALVGAGIWLIVRKPVQKMG